MKVALGGCLGGENRICALKNQLCESCTSRVSLFTPSKEFATYRVAALVSLTGYSGQALGPGQQCINADYNLTLRLLRYGYAGRDV